ASELAAPGAAPATAPPSCPSGVGGPAPCAAWAAADARRISVDLTTGVLSNTVVGTGNVSAITGARVDTGRLAAAGGDVDVDFAVGDVRSGAMGETNQATTELFVLEPLPAAAN
ncbi:MAG: hypothetical protein MI723_18715, partial [Caulobacterales bacterium]|nr:hypothetical protein [Caulobacterales bacterium]